MPGTIRIEKVSKRFVLHHERPRSLQETVLNWLHHHPSGKKEVYWALRDVSFEVPAGESVGIIGPNGAGKSTLLKLVGRILRPTSGRIVANGRISALLELGAGFHPDLTGRENIFLNASVLGVSRRETVRRLDEIVDFAEIGEFIDVPVKHYSSGMQMRLGFAIATTVDPDILIVDEVLAVGDATFQRKCLDRIDHLRQEGVTVLFVSHDPNLVRSVCSHAVWLDHGRVMADGNAEVVAARYNDRSWQSAGPEPVSQDDEAGDRRWGTGDVRIVNVRFLNGRGREKRLFRTGDPLVVEMQYHAEAQIERPVFGLAIHRSDGVHVTGPNTQFSGSVVPALDSDGVVRYKIDRLPLLEGRYALSVAARDWDDTTIYDYHDRLYSFRVRAVDEKYGMIALNGEWEWKSSK